MTLSRVAYSLPKNRCLGWLTQAGPDVPADIHQVLLGEIFAEPRAVVAGTACSVMVSGAAFALHGGWLFLAFMAMDIALVIARVCLAKRAARAAAQGLPTPTDAYLAVAIAWCVLQGTMGFYGMHTGDNRLELASAILVLALVGPICARNFAAPAYAMLLVCLVSMPMVGALASIADAWRWIFLAEAPIFLLGMAVVVRRFNGLAVAALRGETESTFRAQHDSLTGLLNRVGLDLALPLRCQASPVLTLFYLDLDGFKPVNDTFGHHAGDLVLAEVGRRLQRNVRGTDLAARLGGDEFVIAALGAAPHVSEGIARDLIACISNEPYFLECGQPVRIGVSIGIACAPEDGRDPDTLRRNADQALYEAKGAGRGTFRRFGAADGQLGAGVIEGLMLAGGGRGLRKHGVPF